MENLRRLRTERGLTIKELSKRAHVGTDTILKLELGQRGPKPVTVRKLAEALKIDASDLYDGGLGSLSTDELKEIIRVRTATYQRAKAAAAKAPDDADLDRQRRDAHARLMAAVSDLLSRPETNVEEALLAVAS